LQAGDLDMATRLLGRPYSITGRVAHGEKLGRSLGFPTANLPQLLLERDGANTLLRRYLVGLDTISMTTGAAAYYYHYDGLGSVGNLTTSTGAKSWTYTYEPYGATRPETPNRPPPTNPLPLPFSVRRILP